ARSALRRRTFAARVVCCAACSNSARSNLRCHGAMVRSSSVPTFAEVVADRSPTRRHEWPLLAADGAPLSVIAVEQWFEGGAERRVVDVWRRTGLVEAGSLVVAS